jgi:hypothetical protein
MTNRQYEQADSEIILKDILDECYMWISTSEENMIKMINLSDGNVITQCKNCTSMQCD